MVWTFNDQIENQKLAFENVILETYSGSGTWDHKGSQTLGHEWSYLLLESQPVTTNWTKNSKKRLVGGSINGFMFGELKDSLVTEEEKKFATSAKGNQSRADNMKANHRKYAESVGK